MTFTRRPAATYSAILLFVILTAACGSRGTLPDPELPDEEHLGDPEPETESDGFAPEQFEELEDTDKLEPSDFGDAEAGCVIGADGEGCEAVSFEEVDSPQGGVSGPIIRLSVTNTDTDEIIATIPCGMVFEPANTGEQRMMVVQPVTVRVGAGETQEMVPYVMCIDSDKEPASAGAGYSVGTFAREDLLKLAQCVCERDLSAELDPEKGDYGLQVAVWSLADGRSRAEVEAELESTQEMMEQMLPELELEGIEGMTDEEFQSLVAASLIGVEDVSVWFDECGVEPGELVG